MYETVLSEIDGDGIRLITLNRPKSLNAMNRRLIDELARAFDEANLDAETKVIILTGAGRAASAATGRHQRGAGPAGRGPHRREAVGGGVAAPGCGAPVTGARIQWVPCETQAARPAPAPGAVYLAVTCSGVL